MRILVTGASGFIGSHLANALKKDHAVVALVRDHVPTRWAAEALEGCTRVRGDIRDLQLLKRVIGQYSIEWVFHLASQAIVAQAARNPLEAFDSNVMGTVCVLEACRQLDVSKLHVQSCYDTKTRVMTKSGLKRYTEVIVGDEVLSLNTETSEIEWKPVEDVIVQGYQGKMVHFKHKGVDLMVTPNHRMLLYSPNPRRQSTSLRFVRADEMGHRATLLPVGRWIGKEAERVKVEEEEFETASLFYLIGVYIGDGFVNITRSVTPNKTGLSRKEWLRTARDPETGRFIALGKVGNREETVCTNYGVFLDIPEKDPCRGRVEESLKRLGLRYHMYRGKAGEHLFFSSRPLVGLLAECGRKAKSKHIPPWVLEYSPKYLQYVFDGLIDSDGFRGKHQTCFTTTSPELVRDFIELCTKLGLPVSLREEMGRIVDFGDHVSHGGTCYRFYVGRTRRWLRPKSTSLVDYSGAVWCLRVADNANMLVEREGHFAFSGNTDKIYGNTLDATEDSPLQVVEPYATSKIAADLIAQTYRKVYGMRIVVPRSANVFGLDYSNRIIPNAVRSCLRGEDPVVYAGPERASGRQYIYVDDEVRILIDLMEAYEGVFNIPGHFKTQEEVVLEVLKHFPERKPRYVERAAPKEIWRQSMIGLFKPRISFEEGVKLTIDRFREYGF